MFWRFLFAVTANKQTHSQPARFNDNTPDSWVNTAWQTLQGHILSEVDNWAVSG
jgi:hypothetical protein